ncbi:hypothetical protein NSK_004877 [Nannochloropsis salina CCMP1776]|uniref:peptidylprolyl isomerase n=1 Tax=Nannochloropsis salina CCMP1776 TaxID=1027361 RepID=A0A4D9D2V2_9STRA|nr:hypothetical protein NSK_004877 [Nannochloropsis salina CCMP1776]|eukprot:TFJ83775.1 hypothetical protein NSK_004877 [Nannochloropsis salina CCMP1776]
MRGRPAIWPTYLLTFALPLSFAWFQTPLHPFHTPVARGQIWRTFSSRSTPSEDACPMEYPKSSSIPAETPSDTPPSGRPARAWNTISRRGAVAAASTLIPALINVGIPAAGGGGRAQAALEEFPWVTKGGLLDGVLPESVLVESLPLNNQAIKGMGQALSRINELRGLNVLQGSGLCNEAGQVIADLSFVTAATSEPGMLNTTAAEDNGVPGDISTFRWSKIKGLAENVRATYNREKDAFPYALTIRPNTTAESQARRRARFANELLLLDLAISNLENATQHESVADTLRYQEESLLHLGHLGELMVAKFPFSPPKNDDRREDDYFNLPRLFGRAEVIFFLKELGKDKEGSNGNKEENGVLKTANMTVIVDGFNAPISSGNFIDLCQRGFYNRLPLVTEKVRSGNKDDQEVELVVGGRYKTGFVDPITGKQRRVPLEVMRAEPEGNRPFYGQARNTGLFTRAPPLLSYRTPRAIGLLHPEQDGNGANSEFFWLQRDARCVETAKSLDGKFTLIGYVVGGGRENDILPFLDDSFQIESVQVSWGYDHLVRSRVGFIDILLQGDE